jgi:hypothetical protein
MPQDRKTLDFVQRRGRVATGEVATLLGVTRQAAHRRLRRLAGAGRLDQVGLGRGAAWVPAPARTRRFRFRTTAVAEDRMLAHVMQQLPKLGELPDGCRGIFAYAFTELVNNVLDHSGSAWVEVEVALEHSGVQLEVRDTGIGVFERLRAGLGLGSVLEALQELHKGKVTTDRARHTGAGIFFTSRAVRRFDLEANGLHWIVDQPRDDFTVTESSRRRGTRAACAIDRRPARALVEVFDQYTIDLQFARTRTVVRLFAVGEQFVSRSEARRLVSGLERFQEVILDFDRVAGIGQGFADEVFRVWAHAHPTTLLVPVRTVAPVQFMIDRVRAADRTR